MKTPSISPAKTLMLVARQLQTLKNRNLEFYGLGPTQRQLLLLIARNPGLSQSQLPHLLKIDKSSACTLVRKLQQLDLITKRPSLTDHRTNVLYPTNMAKVCAKTFAEEPAYLDTVVTYDFSPAETEQFDKLMRRTSAVIQHVLDLPPGTEFPPFFVRPLPSGRIP